MMRMSGIWLLLGIWHVVGFADAGSAQRAQDVRHVISLSRSAAPEFGSDALLALVEGRLVTDRSSEREILERAFDLAASAEEVAPLAAVQPPTSALTHALAVEEGRGLDRVSLRARVVRAFLRIDPQRARDLFDRISIPPAPTFRCDTRFAYYFKLYYVVMGELVDAIPDPGMRGRLLAEYARRLRSGSEIYPFMTVVTDRISKISSADLAVIAHSVAEKLPGLVQDSATYTWIASAAIKSVTRLAKTLPAGAKQDLLGGMRSWVVRGMGAGICSAAQVSASDDAQHPLPAVNSAAEFNQLLRLVGASEHLAISKEPRPRDAGTLAMPDSFLSQRERYSRVAWMLSLDSGQVRSQVEISRWQREVGAYVAALTQWNDTGERRDEFYLEKSDLLLHAIGLQQIHFPGELKGFEGPDAAKSLVEFLDGDVARGVYRNRRAVWFAPVMFALGSAEHSAGMDSLLLSATKPELQLYGLIGRLLASAGQVYH